MEEIVINVKLKGSEEVIEQLQKIEGIVENLNSLGVSLSRLEVDSANKTIDIKIDSLIDKSGLVEKTGLSKEELSDAMIKSLRTKIE